MTTITLLPKKWTDIAEKLYKDQPFSVVNITWVHKKTFGFSVRHHRECVRNPSSELILTDRYGTAAIQQYICLDFDREEEASLFILRWL